MNWIEYAKSAAHNSPDPSTKVGAVVVNETVHRAVGLGWNDFPPGTPEEWWHDRPKKYAAVVHAEARALLEAGAFACTDATLYVTQHPCSDCAKLISMAKIARVVCPPGPWRDDPAVQASCQLAAEILALGGVEVNHV